VNTEISVLKQVYKYNSRATVYDYLIFLKDEYLVTSKFQVERTTNLDTWICTEDWSSKLSEGSLGNDSSQSLQLPWSASIVSSSCTRTRLMSTCLVKSGPDFSPCQPFTATSYAKLCNLASLQTWMLNLSNPVRQESMTALIAQKLRTKKNP